MKRIKQLFFLSVSGVFCIALPPPVTLLADASPLLVVVSKATGIRDISKSDLRRAFLGELTVVQGIRLVPLNQPPGTAPRAHFDRQVLGVEPDRIGAFWINRRIRDQTPPPRTLPTESLTARVVAALPGAISYVAPESLNPGLVAVSIDGDGPGSHGYLLR